MCELKVLEHLFCIYLNKDYINVALVLKVIIIPIDSDGSHYNRNFIFIFFLLYK